MDVSSADQIHFTYAPGTSLEQMIGLEMAGQFWSSYLADDVSVNVFVEMIDYLPDNVIGGALPGIEADVEYSEFRQKLTQDITSDIDISVDNNQQNEADEFTAFFRSQFDDLTGYKVDDNEYLRMTRANAKALGIRDAHDGRLDGYILMRNLDGSGSSGIESLSWQYNYSDDFINSDSLDFLSVAIHEVGHVLGFISGVDQPDWLSGLGNISQGDEADYYSQMAGTLNNVTPMDMLRFSQESYQMSGDGENWIDMSIGGNPFLSFTGSGGNPVAYFSTGENTSLGGDGYQASHWKKNVNSPLGIMDPVLSTGQRRQISQLDKELFDAIGWDLKLGNANLATINTQAKTSLAQSIGQSLDWLETNSAQAANLLTPQFLDANGNGYDDRNEQLEEMFVNSGEAYEWGWSGHWAKGGGYQWGWSGHWSKGKKRKKGGGYRQSVKLLPTNPFWQNFSWQTVEVPSTSAATFENNSSPESSGVSLQVLTISGSAEPVFSDLSSNTVQELDLDIVEDRDDVASNGEDKANVTSNNENNDTLLGAPSKVELNWGWSGHWDDWGNLAQPNWGWSGHWGGLG